MWNPFRAILGSPKALTDIVEGGVSALDKAFFTDEEKADGRRTMLDVITNYMAKTTGQDITRRMLALGVIALFGSLCFAIVMFLCFEDPQPSGELYRAGLLKDFMAESVAKPIMLVLGFYFAPHLLAQLLKIGK